MTATRTTMSSGRRAVFKAQARARFDRGERELLPEVKRAISEYLSILRSAAQKSPVLTAASKPPRDSSAADVARAEANDAADADLFSESDAADLIDTLDQKGLFGAILDRTIMPALAQQLVPVLQAGMSRPDTSSSLTAWRNDWLAQRRQELVDIPDAITAQLRTELQGAASARGTTVDDARLLVDNMLDDGYPSWEGRAQLIARTETVGANNQGSLAAMTASADADGLAGTKTWLATDDEKTREDHAEVDGTTVGLSETFDVGGVEMNGPGDNAGGASQVCNCRCTMTYAFSAPEDTGDDSSTSGDNSGDNGTDQSDTSDDLTAAGDFEEDKHPRDAHGRFGSGGSEDEAAAVVTPARSFAEHATMSNNEATTLLDQARAGGFTYDVAGKSSPKTGYSVSPYPDRTAVVDTKDLSASTISDYVAKNSDLLDQPGHHLGGWRETKPDGTDRVWLDVSIVSQSQAAATATATAHNQVAIFDLGSGTTIDTGGTGTYGYQARTRQADEARAGRSPESPPRRAGPDEAEGLEEGQVTAAAADPPTGVAVMAKLSATDAARAAVADGEAPDSLHVTLGYLAKPAADYGPDDQTRIVGALTSAELAVPIAADAFATAHFNPEDDERDPCAVVLVQSDELATAHDAVSTALGGDLSTTFPIWIPHVTIAYNADPTVIPVGIAGSTFTFDRVVIGWAGQEMPIAGGVDSSADTGGDALTAATEAPVTAPTTAPPAATDAPSATPEATGGDTPAETVPSEALEPTGITWSGPLMILDEPASDGRVISSTGGTIRPLPQPLKWQKEDGPEHDGAVIVGRILSAEIRGNQLWGTGDWLDPALTYETAQAMAQVDAGLGFVSCDLAVSMIGFRDAETMQPIDPALVDPTAQVLEEAVEWECGGATILSFAAFRDARIQNDVPATDAEPIAVTIPTGGAPMMSTFAVATPEKSQISEDGKSILLPDGTTATIGDGVAWQQGDEVETGTISSIDSVGNTVTVTPDPDADDGTDPQPITVDVATLVPIPDDAPDTGDAANEEAALLASSEIRPYRAEFFNEHKLDGPTPLRVDAETGEVFGHLATKGECHLGKLMEGKCVTMPDEPNEDFSYFHLSDVATDDGGLVSVGKITLGTGHAGRGGMRYALAHYDNSGTAVAVVRAYRDAYGIQVAGQIIHDTPAAKIEELMRSPLSGDWRGVDGKLRLTAALAVNNPGFPVRRPVVGMSGNRQISLVAAGVVELPERRVLTDLVLPSGRTIARDDFEALTAAAVEAIDVVRNRRDATDDEVEIARARLRLVGGRRRSA